MAPPHPKVGVGTRTLPARPLITARASSRQLPPFLPPRSPPQAPPQPRGPAGPGGSPGTHTHLAAGSAGPARGQGPIPRRIPQRRRRLTAEGPGSGGTPGRRGPGPPCPQAKGRARSRGHGSSPPRAARLFPTGLGRAEPPKAQGGGGAERLREACEGKEAGVTGQRRGRSKQTPAACPEPRGGSSPGVAGPHGATPRRDRSWWLEVDAFQKCFCFRLHAAPSKQISRIHCRALGNSQGSVPGRKRTQQFWECCWAFPHSPSGILSSRGKTASPFATLEVNPHAPSPLNLYFCSALGGSCWLEAPTWSVSLKPGMPGSAGSLQEKLLCSLLLPQPRRSSRRGICLVPSWHQSQQLLQPSRALNPSNPNFQVFLCLLLLFPLPSWGQHPMGTLLQGKPRSQLCCSPGNLLDMGQDTAPGDGEKPPPTLSPSPNPLHAATFASSSTRRALPTREAGREGGSGGAQARRGGSGTPRVSVRALCCHCNRKPCSQAGTAAHSPSPSRCRGAAVHPTDVTH